MPSFGFDFDERNVIALIGPDIFRRVTGLIAQDNFNGLRAFDNMVVGENVAARIDDKTRTGAFYRDGVHKEIVLSRLSQDIGHGWRDLAVDAYVDGFVLGQRGVRGERATAPHGFDFSRVTGAKARSGPEGAKN